MATPSGRLTNAAHLPFPCLLPAALCLQAPGDPPRVLDISAILRDCPDDLVFQEEDEGVML